MDALLICGGRGTRLDAPVEKPLLEVDGTPMVDRVRDALDGSRVDEVYAVVSPHAPETRAHLDHLPAIETPGEGYVADLGRALSDDRVDRPVLTAVADLPLLSPPLVDRLLDGHSRGSMTACVPVPLKRLLGLSVDTTMAHGGRDLAPAGLNVVGARVEAGDGGGEDVHVSYDARLAANVNRLEDAEVAEALA